MKVLVTGAASGFGRFAHRRLRGLGLTRGNAAAVLKKAGKGVDLILHCAGSAGKAETPRELSAMSRDNVLLTERLVSIPHKRFILLSTVDVYPRSWRRFSEARPIPPREAPGFYGLTKLMAERVVLARAKKPLILRCASLLGKDSRPNAFTRVLSGRGKLSLAASSRLNCVRHEDVLGFIEAAVRRGLTGVFNLAAAKPVALGALAKALGAKPRFGAHRYDAGPVDNRKAAAVWPPLKRTALETARAWAS